MAAKRKAKGKAPRRTRAKLSEAQAAAAVALLDMQGEETFAVSRVSDASEVVVITKDLSGNPIEGAAWDPMLRVDLQPLRSDLHPGDGHPSPGDIENIRASGLRRLVSRLVSALFAAERTGVIPPALTDAEWRARFEHARAAEKEKAS
jgi:hypothetical protein